MKKALIGLVLLAALAAAFWAYDRQSDLPRVPFAKPLRESISNTLSTNGKVEPLEYAEVRVDTSGLVKQLPIHPGDTVRKGQLLAELSQPGSAEELAAAEARAAQARAELETLRAGGRSGDIAEIDGSLSRLRVQRESAVRNADTLDRLLKSNAATKFEADQARQTVRDLDAQIQALMQKGKSLVGVGDVASAEARVRETEANVQLAKTHNGRNMIYAPMAGTIYSLSARLGAYLNAGDSIGSIGKLDPVRVRVYVDEPELGRVDTGEPVRITWDAIPGKEWTGVVEKRPGQVVALGTRQVGETLCTIGNPGRELLPGTNVNAFVLTQVVQNALTISKTAVRRDNGVGVYVLDRTTNTVKWLLVKTGSSNALRVEITDGLKEGDLVALPTDQTIKAGDRVSPVFP